MSFPPLDSLTSGSCLGSGTSGVFEESVGVGETDATVELDATVDLDATAPLEEVDTTAEEEQVDTLADMMGTVELR